MANPYLQSLQQSALNQTPQTLFLLDGIQDPIVRQNFETLNKELAKRLQKGRVGKCNVVFGPTIASQQVTDSDGLATTKRPGGLSVEVTTKGNPVQLFLLGPSIETVQASTALPMFQVTNAGSALAFTNTALVNVGWERNGKGVSVQQFGGGGNAQITVRGIASWDGATLTKIAGNGWSVSRSGVGIYVINWSGLFGDAPGFAVTVANEIFHGQATVALWSTITTSGATIKLYDPNAAALVDGSFSFVASGNYPGNVGNMNFLASFPAFGFVDVVPAGTYQYQFFYAKNSSEVIYSNIRAVAIELP